tara:strand:- start:158936 stop:160459 length:1524 start_codon:yes stop_codon:yes gene_type:complete
MKNYKLLIWVSAILLTIYSCSEDTIAPLGTGTISGTVIDAETGDSLSGVKISTNPSSSTVFSDASGAFTILNVNVDDYSVQAELTNYVTAFESITVTQDATATVAFELDESNSNNQPPTIPNLLFPEDNATDVLLEVEFIWNSSDPENDELSYTLDLRNGTTNEMQFFETGQDTTYTVSNLQLGTNYFWQVTVMDEFNDPVNSEIGEFTTLTAPDNPFLLVKKINGNSVIFSGDDDGVQGTGGVIDFNLLQLTSENTNSFKPRRNNVVNKVAFLRTEGGEANIYTMNLDGTEIQQVTNAIPVAGFKLEELNFTWANDGQTILYPNFDKLYEIDPDGGGAAPIYETTDGSFISEVQVATFDDDLLLLKTNDMNGYNVRIFTYDLSLGMEVDVVREGEMGAASSINLSANADEVLFTLDKSGSENPQYRRFENRIHRYTISDMTLREVDSEVVLGENDLEVRYSPTEGGAVLTRRGNNLGSTPAVYTIDFGQVNDDNQIFSEASMPDWN